MSDPMKFKVIIDKKGKVVTEVLDRGEHLCTDIYKITTAVGKQLSDDQIGPDCDTVNEFEG